MNPQQSFWYLENVDVADILCPTKVSATQDSLEHKTFAKGDYIYLQGDYADKIFFIMEGRVKVGSYSDNGKEITKAILHKGEVFGEMPLAGEDMRRNFAQAMESR